VPQTLTVELPDVVIDRIRTKAAHRNASAKIFAAQLLVEHVEADAGAFDPATIAAIRAGIADGEAGREQSFEEHVAEMRAHREARRLKA
jgi:predicted transcriptional regulator